MTSSTALNYPQKKYKKSTTGLHDDWVKRAQVEGLEDDDDDIDVLMTNTSRSRSVGSVVSLSGSSHLATSLLNSDDNHEGGISDDAGEKYERVNLKRKAMRPNLNTRGSGYHRSESPLAGGARVSVDYGFPVQHVTQDIISSPALSPQFLFPPLSNQTQVPTSPK